MRFLSGESVRHAYLILALLIPISASANTDLVLQNKLTMNLDRPISVVITDDLPEPCDRADEYACAVGAYGNGRCIIFIKPDKMQFLYHEIQHCAGIQHTERGD